MSEVETPRDGGSQAPSPPVWLALALAVGLLAGAISGAAVAFLNDSGSDSGGGTSAAPSGAAAADRVAQVASQAVSSVVAIINEYEAQGDEPAGTAGGAGVIIDERGYILTNAHIVLLPGSLFVILNDGSVRPATVVSHDAPFTDIAVIQVQGGGLKALSVGDSAKLTPGQTLIAIGSPDIDYFNSVTVGVVSGLQRRKQLAPGAAWLEDLIQTDAAINVGNSGGPLIDLNGQVVGINTFRDTGGGDPLFGIAFAISSRTFGPIADAMIRTGKFPRPYFGVEHTDLSEETATTKGLKADTQGAYLEKVLADSPASAAGLRVGDIVTKIGSFDVTPSFTLLSALGQTQPSANVDVAILRNNQPITVKVQLRPR